jgi:hypothetical protein
LIMKLFPKRIELNLGWTIETNGFWHV